MAENKTKPTQQSVDEFIDAIDNETMRADCKALMKLLKKVTGEKPTMWGPSMVGYGSYHYKYDSGHEGDAFTAGFSPRKQNLTIYFMSGFSDHFDDLMPGLGTYKTGKSCLYVKKLADIDIAVLEEMVKRSVAFVKEKYPA